LASEKRSFHKFRGKGIVCLLLEAMRNSREVDSSAKPERKEVGEFTGFFPFSQLLQ
jgi:hypothetical protein